MPGNILSLTCPVCGKNCEGWPNMSTRDCFSEHLAHHHGTNCKAPEECKEGDVDCPICGEVVTKEGEKSASKDMKEHFDEKHSDMMKKT